MLQEEVEVSGHEVREEEVVVEVEEVQEVLEEVRGEPVALPLHHPHQAAAAAASPGALR